MLYTQPKFDKKIWLLEDDEEAILIYREVLGLRYSLVILRSLDELATALAGAKQEQPHLLIADLRLPDGDFIGFLNQSEYRDQIAMPFIVVSSYDDIDILRACFQKGASDYLIKPFMKNELIVKIERLLTLPGLAAKPTRVTDQVEMRGSSIRRGKKPFTQLTTKELKIFSILSSAKEPISRERLQTEVWGGVSVTPKTLDVHIFNLRKKLEAFDLEIRFVAPDSFLLGDRVDTDESLDLGSPSSL